MKFEHTRFLIVRLSSIGDVLHATTVAHNLKLHYPHCHISWIASPPASELLVCNPDIDELLLWDRRAFDQAITSLKPAQIKKSLRALRDIFSTREFDIVLDIQCLFLTGIISWMSGAKRRIGIHERHEFNHLFMTERGPRIDDPHKILHYMSSLAPLGIDTLDPTLILKLPSSLDDFAENFFSEHAISTQRPLLMVNTRTTWPDKNWPPESFAQALRSLPEKIQLVFCGAPQDQPYIAKIMDSLDRPAISIAGQTSLLELAALFQKADLLLTGDTGPLYIAVSVGLPTLSLWGPTHPSIYGPLTSGHNFILSPYDCISCCKTHCHEHTNGCMNAIPPDTVHRALCHFFHID